MSTILQVKHVPVSIMSPAAALLVRGIWSSAPILDCSLLLLLSGNILIMIVHAFFIALLQLIMRDTDVLMVCSERRRSIFELVWKISFVPCDEL